jgi:hypothetical protein
LQKCSGRTTIIGMTKLTPILAAIFLVLSAGCAPEIGRSLSAPLLPEPEIAAGEGGDGEAVRVRIGHFQDARPSQTIVTIDGRKVDSEGPLTRSVEEGFERYLRRAGARIAVLNAPTIEGQVTDWAARIEPGFPTSQASAVARLKVTVRDSRGHPIYHATFSGESKASHPMLGVDGVQRLLGQAMGSAIEAAVRDDDFVAQLSKGRIG